ncbi:hypothetical protein Aab01nite_78410 [Paractinoplanes abujensis]|uniref:Uncharacterized protein n=1 Tax=Paractinoplanes abujensis TaxID=882441 RepID=A0A7W7CQ02_9ACTN|nr:hypothetical protein [Actinoplanes abujensis]MBB4692269.1 hypothetical protein [Actinoplanes abujensis]GID24251.1 hypothetical protein Aab01nite_78410 [Actinoplanes abujensis]
MPSGGVGRTVELTPDQQEQLQRLLEQELRDALRVSSQRHDPAAVADLVAERRRALERLAGRSAHDVQDPLDEDLEGDGVVEQR